MLAAFASADVSDPQSPNPPDKVRPPNPWWFFLMSPFPLTHPPLPGGRQHGTTAALGVLVGALTGAFYALVYWAAAHFFPNAVACGVAWALSVAINWIVIDGLADCADGFCVPRSAEESLRIMREPSSGVAGICAIVVFVGLQLLFLTSVPPGRAVVAIVVTSVTARWACLVSVYRADPRGNDTLLAPYVAELGPVRFGLATLVTLGIAVECMGPGRGLAVVAAALVCALGVRRVGYARIGGMNGDVAGAALQIALTASWLVAAAR
ncbi:MAG: adenosylcobinamide-GDP ribazoletransferase [Labilithrix sp.]|nr:adenosylcobinamide-GDP ribazoletransferase [Labilithrix sp.]